VVQFRAFRVLRGETPENENKANSNPIKPNFSDPNPRFSSNIGDFDDFYTTLFMQNKANL
jgi:hypothetical protein